MTAPTELDGSALEIAAQAAFEAGWPHEMERKEQTERNPDTLAGYRKIVGPAIRAYLSALPASEAGWPEREEGVDEVILPYAKFISARPELLSLLYDIDMLPEQCVTRVGAVRLAGLCEVWRRGEDGSLPSAPDRRAGE